MTWQSIGPWVGFQCVWFICAYGAAHGSAAPGTAAALAFSGAMILASRPRAQIIALVAISGAVGFVVETVLVSAGIIHFSAPWPSTMLAPVWIIGLWAAFGATLPTLSAALGRHRHKTAAIVGAVGGPLAYLAGSRLGALQILGSIVPTLAILAVTWAGVLSCLVRLADRRV